MSSMQSPGAVPIREWKWTPAEKATAHRAFDAALKRELEAVVREAKDRVATIVEASELWELEHWLAERRRQINDTFDFRYSVLPIVFATLLREGRLAEEELTGLGPTNWTPSVELPAFKPRTASPDERGVWQGELRDPRPDSERNPQS